MELQSYILSTTTETAETKGPNGILLASIVHPFNNNWNSMDPLQHAHSSELQSYILSTTTETCRGVEKPREPEASIVHPFNNNWNWREFCTQGNRVLLQSYILSTTTETTQDSDLQKKVLASIVHPFNNNWNSRGRSLTVPTALLQSYILSTTTETLFRNGKHKLSGCFNRTSFQQQLKQFLCYVLDVIKESFNRTSFQQQLKRRCSSYYGASNKASIVHPFNNNWNFSFYQSLSGVNGLQSYILSTTTETVVQLVGVNSPIWLQSYILSTTTETLCLYRQKPHLRLQSYILSTTTETTKKHSWIKTLRLQSYILSTTTETRLANRKTQRDTRFNRTSFQQQLKQFVIIF